MSSTDIAGVVGTWLAVGLAMFALIGVVGPLLVWRASKSARNQALAKLDKGISTSHGFVTKGVRFGPATYLFRRVRAPILTDTLGLSPEWKPKYTDNDLPSQKSAGWVQLGAVLQNYGLKYPTGDALIFKDETVRLTISTVWLFVFGLIGPYGSRIDKGEWITEATDDVFFEQALPGQRLGRRVTSRATRARKRAETVYIPPNVEDDWDSPGWYRSRDARVVAERIGRSGDGKLHGSTGRIKCYRRGGDCVVDFKAHKKVHIEGLTEEVLDIARLFWLSMGCLPMTDGRVFYLEDVQYATQEARSDSPWSDDMWSHPESLPDVDPFGTLQQREYPPHGRPTPHHLKVKHYHPPRFQEPRFWAFQEIDHSLADFVGLAAALGAERNISKRSLTDVVADPHELIALREEAKRTFIPCHRNWVRLGPTIPEGSSFSAFFLARGDAQLLARVLLQIPICSQGYLIHIPMGSACRDMLVEACSFLPRMLYFLVAYYDHLKTRTPQGQLDDSLLPNLEELLRMTSNYSYTRLFASALYDLDHSLVSTVSRKPDVHLFVQVLVITSQEFRDLISHSLRELGACLDMESAVAFDAAHATMCTWTIMGALKEFPIHLDVLLDDPRGFPQSGLTNVSYVDVLFLVLKACVRSAFLETSLDSTPLFDAVFKPGSDVFEAS